MNQPRNNPDFKPYESTQQTPPQNPQLDATPNAAQSRNQPTPHRKRAAAAIPIPTEPLSQQHPRSNSPT